MGVTIQCERTGNSIDLGYGGSAFLREKIAMLAGKEFGEHYSGLSNSKAMLLDGEARKKFYKDHDAKTEEMIKSGRLSIKIADFCYQPDCSGSIHYGACKTILKAIGDYDDDIAYGYCGRPDCAKFRDFKLLLQECVKCKSDLVWR